VDILTLAEEKKLMFDSYLHRYLEDNDISSGIFDAFSYSLKAGGKRIRPILTMLACEALGGDPEETLPAGLAIEMIHTFSLIHDDLPAIDNDDLRRGMPTCHARFGEATAILAGDALIFQALSVISGAPYPTDAKLDILRFLAEVCGAQGLVQGEYDDVMAEGKPLDLTAIQEIYRKKTARLFELCMFAGARIACSDQLKIRNMVSFGTHLGLAFQAIDDILDITSDKDTLGKTSGKDMLQDKATIVKALGLSAAGTWAQDMTGKALTALEDIDGKAPAMLKELALTMLRRVQ